MNARLATRTLAAGLGLATAAAVMVGTPSSQALDRANTTVTIVAEGTDLSGTVLSKRRACKDERKVFLVKQKGAKGGDDDKVISSDTTELENGVGNGAPATPVSKVGSTPR